MKKTILLLCLMAGLTFRASADEGMWLLPLLEKMNEAAMIDLGCELTADQIYSINHSSLKDAVVQFGGGCTGEIISDKGLLVTNHHCGYGAIRTLSSTEHNYLEDGYWAKGMNEELPAPGLSVTFLQSMKDVTKIVQKASDQKEAIAQIEKQASGDNPNCRCKVVSFYNANYYYLIVSKVYRDVRFVGAPPSSLGKFGGDTDNWMWPRHTCDFSMFRVYAGPDNEPADYSENNVPLRPRQSLKVSLKGLKDGDFAMIMGYPGSTQRFQTAQQLQSMIDLNDVKISARTVYQDVLWKEMRSDEKVALQYASKYSGSSNGWKKWIGEKASFEKLDIIGREKQKEEEFKLWIAQNAGRQKKYGNALEDIDSYSKAMSANREKLTLFNETIGRIELLSFANGTSDAAYKDYDANVDKKVAAALIAHYVQNADSSIALKVPGWEINKENCTAYVDYLFANSDCVSSEKRSAAKEAGKSMETDPAFQLFNAGVQALGTLPDPGVDPVKKDAASKAFTAGLLEWKKGEPSYPDANLTCRLTYGTVKSYSPKDGVIYKHYTTLGGVLEKEDPDNYEFRVPAKLKEIYESRDFGQYATQDGQVPACFLTTCDITGGNSGSPVMNSKGELIGLAFDGNWEAMSSDVMFEPNLQRCICVDIRYVLFIMDKFGGAAYLLDEMKIEK